MSMWVLRVKVMPDINDVGKIRNKLPVSLQKEFDDLKKYDAQVMKALQDPKMARLFYLDPGAALKKIGVPLSPGMAEVLEKNKSNAGATRAKQYLFPGGDVVTPKVTVRFTGIRGR